MIQLRAIRLFGNAVEDAAVQFTPGANVVTGDSDTGKSFILECVDFALGATKIARQLPEAAKYEALAVELESDKGKFLTIERSLSGGDPSYFYGKGDSRQRSSFTPISLKRSGKSESSDLSALIMEFAGIPEARVRGNDRGKTQRLTLRTLMPLFLVDENAMISVGSPVLGDVGYDETARKRGFSFLLTRKDDSSVVATEKREIVQAGQRAKIDLIEDLLRPIEERLAEHAQSPQSDVIQIEKIEESINRLTEVVADDQNESHRLQEERSHTIGSLQRAESQLIALGELETRYDLLGQRYRSDLDRLDFIAEGAFFLEGLQEMRCPVCDQPLDADHRAHLDTSDSSQKIYAAAKAEAGKIRGLLSDLSEAVLTLKDQKSVREAERQSAQQRIEKIELTLTQHLEPRLTTTQTHLNELIQARLSFEARRADFSQAEGLRKLRDQLLREGSKPTPKHSWEGLDRSTVHRFCLEVQGVLREWAWPGGAQVSFNEQTYDIEIDGKPRRSHGKGVRAILRSAFVIGLLRLANNGEFLHLGFVVIDSPLTTFKRGKSVEADRADIAPEIEAAFWSSVAKTDPSIQIIILENKDPAAELADRLNLLTFTGPNGTGRKGFIPV